MKTKKMRCSTSEFYRRLHEEAASKLQHTPACKELLDVLKDVAHFFKYSLKGLPLDNRIKEVIARAEGL